MPPPTNPSSGTISKPSSTSPKTFYKTPSPFEQKIGYYRGIRHGQHIFISGTTAVDPSSTPPQIQFPNDARQQMKIAVAECIQAVKSLGGVGVENVVRVRMFVGRHEDCAAVQEAFTEVFGKDQRDDNNNNNNNGEEAVGTAATMLVMRGGFVDPDMLVEVEVDAMV